MKIKYFFIGILSVAVVLAACKDVDDFTFQVEQSSVEANIPRFANEAEYLQALSQVSAMKAEERQAYEASLNYVSLGTASEQFYTETDFENFQSLGEVMEFVADNSDYLQIVENEYGELEVETRLYTTGNRYLVNRDGLMMIGDSIVKFTEDGYIKAHIRDLSDGIELTNVHKISEIGRFEPYQEVVKTIYRNGSKSCFSDTYTWRSTDGRDRLKAELQMKKDGAKKRYCNLIVRPYKRTAGIWYWCSRTISAKANVIWGYKRKGESTRTTESWSFFQDYVHDSSIEAKSKTLDIPSSESQYTDLGFDKFTVWADSYSTAPINASCQ